MRSAEASNGEVLISEARVLLLRIPYFIITRNRYSVLFGGERGCASSGVASRSTPKFDLSSRSRCWRYHPHYVRG